MSPEAAQVAEESEETAARVAQLLSVDTDALKR
jgi:hypothetical protein